MSLETVGIIGAMEEEIHNLLQELEEVNQEERYGIVFYRGNLQGVPVVLCKCGVGKVNAAITAMTLVDHFRVKNILFTGVAGALDPQLDIGDIVISTDCQYHDVDVTALGFAKGVIPFQEHSIFLADKKLIQYAKEACNQLDKVKSITGRVLTGDQFIVDKDTSRYLHHELQGACVEMEGAAVAHVAHLTGVPFVIIRSMSDRADHSAAVNFAEFTVLASKHSSYVVQYMLRKLSE